MIERNPNLLVCGHGSALRDPMPYLQSARAGWAERLNNFTELNPRTSTGPYFDPFI